MDVPARTTSEAIVLSECKRLLRSSDGSGFEWLRGVNAVRVRLAPRFPATGRSAVPSHVTAGTLRQLESTAPRGMPGSQQSAPAASGAAAVPPSPPSRSRPALGQLAQVMRHCTSIVRATPSRREVRLTRARSSRTSPISGPDPNGRHRYRPARRLATVDPIKLSACSSTFTDGSACVSPRRGQFGPSSRDASSRDALQRSVPAACKYGSETTVPALRCLAAHLPPASRECTALENRICSACRILRVDARACPDRRVLQSTPGRTGIPVLARSALLRRDRAFREQQLTRPAPAALEARRHPARSSSHLQGPSARWKRSQPQQRRVAQAPPAACDCLSATGRPNSPRSRSGTCPWRSRSGVSEPARPDLARLPADVPGAHSFPDPPRVARRRAMGTE